jgi:UDP-2-acetamido-3-amino-2,3-dideoxy-glucuronate N-acetyltransferase
LQQFATPHPRWALSESLAKNKIVKIDKKNYFVHETAIVDEGAIIGDNTKIWHYSHICKGAIIGKNCNIGQNVFIAGDAILGDNCKVQNNVSIYAGVEAGDYVFFGPSCVLTNDINPRGMYSKNGEYIKTKLEDGGYRGFFDNIYLVNPNGADSKYGKLIKELSKTGNYYEEMNNDVLREIEEKIKYFNSNFDKEEEGRKPANLIILDDCLQWLPKSNQKNQIFHII